MSFRGISSGPVAVSGCESRSAEHSVLPRLCEPCSCLPSEKPTHLPILAQSISGSVSSPTVHASLAGGSPVSQKSLHLPQGDPSEPPWRAFASHQPSSQLSSVGEIKHPAACLPTLRWLGSCRVPGQAPARRRVVRRTPLSPPLTGPCCSEVAELHGQGQR